MWRRRLRYYLLKFLRLKGTPGKVALGFAAGACINFFPTFGFGFAFAAFAAGLVRGNIPAGVLGDLIFKPLFPIFFYWDLALGAILLNKPIANIPHVIEKAAFFNKEVLVQLGTTFLVGACVNSVILGTILFLLVYILFRSYRREMIKFVQEKI